MPSAKCPFISLSLRSAALQGLSPTRVSSFFLSLIKNAEEEKALREGVKRHGMGRWKYIKTDPEFSQCLTNRSNVDLKDKWRNILVAQGVSFCVCLSLCVCVCVCVFSLLPLPILTDSFAFASLACAF